MQKLLPFALALAAGLLLAGVARRAPSRQSRHFSRTGVARQREHSKTWLFVTSLPGHARPRARGGGQEGSVLMRVVFGEDGIVRDAQTEAVAVSGITGEDAAAFAREALAAAGRIRFRSATVDGRPVALGATVEYNCSTSDMGHTAFYGCGLSIVKVDDDWRIIYE